MAIYKNPTFDMAVRLDAAKAAAPYEKPKLASTEFKGDPDKPVQHKLTIEFVRAGEKYTLVSTLTTARRPCFRSTSFSESGYRGDGLILVLN